MKKNFVKKLALGLALVMAVTSVPASSEAAAAPGFKSSAVKVRVGQTKKYSTENSKKYSVKFVIGNKKVATIKYTAGSKSVKVTGVAEGETKLRAEFKSYKTKEVTKVRIPVTVLAAKEETPVVTTTELAAVKQTASNAFEATFTGDASALVNAENITITSADELYTSYVDDIKFSTDGKSAIITVYGNLVDKAVYNVTVAEKTASFTASVGKVATAVVKTVQAQENIATDIEFALYDAAGIDVTNAVDVETFVTLEVDGDYADCELADPTEATITLNNVGDKATVTLTYDTFDGSAEVKATGTVVCVSAQATVGTTTIFTKSDMGTPKIYLNSFAPSTTLYEGDENKEYYFTALDENGLPIEYEYYEIESSNEDVVTVVAEGELSGKYASFTVNAGEIGTAKIIIKATKNEKETVYYGTIKVLAEKVLKTVVLDKSSIAVSNLEKHDNDKVKVTVLDQYGAPYSNATVDIEMNDEDATAAETVVTEGTKTPNPIFGSVSVGINAEGIEADSYVVKVTVTDNNTDNDKEIVKKFTVKVKTATDKGDYTYKVELDTTSVDLNPETYLYGTSVGVKLAKYVGSVFAGYEDFDDTKVYVSKGSVEFETLNLYALDKKYDGAVTGSAITGDELTLKTVDTTSKNELDGSTITNIFLMAGKGKNGVAETGTYKVKVVFNEGDEDEFAKTATFAVKNTMEMPKITVDATTAKASDLMELVEECVTVDIDILEDEEYSICNALDSDLVEVEETKEGSNKYAVKYVVVCDQFVDYLTTTEDNVVINNFYYYVPVNKTFTAK